MKVTEVVFWIFISKIVRGFERVSYETCKLSKSDTDGEEQVQKDFADSNIFSGVWEPEQPSNTLFTSHLQRHFNVSSDLEMKRHEASNGHFERSPRHERYSLDQGRAASAGEITFDSYHRYDMIVSYMYILASDYSHIVRLERLGKSSEGRHLLAVQISTGGNGTKPLIFVDAGMHASEWLSPAQALFIIQQLVENPNNRHLIEKVDWVVFPLVNPDGYEFTFRVTRLWRKTRSKGINCIGTDPNRNFDFHWGEAGASADECDRRYRGPAPFSEPETRAVRNLMLKYSKNLKLYITFHTYGQLVLYPWGYTEDPPPNVEELDDLGRRVARAIEEVAGSQFAVGSIRKLLYLSSGDSISWAMGVVGVDLAYAIELQPKLYELPPKTKIALGDNVPAKAIKRCVVEVFEGVKIFHQHVEDKYTLN